MPYKKGEVPDRIKMLPAAAQDIWISAFNSAWDEYNGSEEKANAVAWSAVEKAGYYKNEDGKWVKKESISQESMVESRKTPHEINETVFTTMLLEEQEGEVYLSGPFMQADTINLNKRYYERKTVQKIIDAINTGVYAGYNGHPSIFQSKSPAEYSVKHVKAWLSEDGIAYNKFKILNTREGQDLKVIAKEKIPIPQSVRGYGEETWERTRDAFRVEDDVYDFRGIDNVDDPSFKIAQAVMEQKQRGQRETQNTQKLEQEVKMEEQIKKLLEEVTSLKTQVKDLTEASKTNAELVKQVNDLKAKQTEAETKLKNLQEVQAKIKTIIADTTQMTGLEEFKEPITKRLAEYQTVAEIELAWPLISEKYRDLKGVTATKPKVRNIDIKDLSVGHKFPCHLHTNEEVYNFMLSPYEKKTGAVQEVAQQILDNFIAGHMTGHDEKRIGSVKNIVERCSRNPLTHFTETLGDNEMYTSDVTTSGAAVLPILYIAMQDVMNIVNEVVGVSPLDRPTAIVPFYKQYYGDGSGTYTEIGANFDKTAGETAEGSAGKNLKFKILTTAVSLETALKFYTEFTREIEQDLRAYYNLDLDSGNIQLMREEVMRALSHKILYALFAGTSLANSDNKVQATGSPLTFNIAALEGYTQGEWEDRGVTKVVKQAGAFINKVPWQVTPDCIIVDSDYDYLFTAKQFVSSGIPPTNFGFNYVGTFSNQYKVFTTTHATYDAKILLTYRGNAIMAAAQLFCPYQLLYIDSLIPISTTLQASRSVMSRFALPKIVGQKVSIINIVG